MTPRWATTAIFAVNGAAVGVWVAQIPWVQERFDLSKSSVGLLILAMAISVILALPIAGQAVVRHGSERMALLGGIVCVLAVNLPILATAPLLVAAGLFVFGGAERHDGRLDEQPRRLRREGARAADHVLPARRLGVRRDGRRELRRALPRARSSTPTCSPPSPRRCC